MGSPDGFPTMRDYQDTLVAVLFSLMEDSLMAQVEVHLVFQAEVPQAPWLQRMRYPWSIWTTLWTSPWTIWISWWRSSRSTWPSRGGFSGPPGDSGSQGPPGQSFMWQRGSTLDQRIVDMHWSVMQ